MTEPRPGREFRQTLLREETVRDLELCRESYGLVVGRMRGLPDGSYRDKLAYQAGVLAKWIARYRERLAE